MKNIVLKNILHACRYWAVGFGVVDESYSFTGGTSAGRFFLHDYTNNIDFFFQFTFAVTAAAIVTGTADERCQMVAYLCHSVFLTACAYPIVVHTVGNGDGFLSAFNESLVRGVGMIDFAGSGAVHRTGEATTLVAVIILGPLIGRVYDEYEHPLDKPHDFPPHSVALQVLGTLFFWFR